MTYEEYEIESDGKLTCEDGTHQGLLILESFKGHESLRIFKFDLDPAEQKPEINCFYRISRKFIDGAKCPECQEIFFDEDENTHMHEDGCKFRFKKGEIIKILNQQANQTNLWKWHDDPYYTFESALLHLFEYSYCKNTPQFQKLEKFIYQKTNYLYKLVNKD